MKSEPITPSLSLSSIFGAMDARREAQVRRELAKAADQIRVLCTELTTRTSRPWRSEGLQLDAYPSGQLSISDYVENDEVTFWVELRPEPDRAPSGTSSPSCWMVEGRVSVVSDAAIDAGQDVVYEIPSEVHDSPEAASQGLVKTSTALVRLALERTPTAADWRELGSA